MAPLLYAALRRATLIFLTALALAACGEGEDKRTAGGGEQTAAGTPPATGCRQVDQPDPKPDGGQDKPTERLDPKKTYTVTVKTNCGSFSWRLDVRTSPKTAASIVALAEADFYDNTTFHRIAPDFVIQGGDPTGTGSGGPGYKTVDKPPSGTKYTKGVVAMAKGGNEPKGTAGSQFFVITGPGGRELTADYAVVGKVTNGMDVVDRIGGLGTQEETPTQVVVIQDLTVKES
jgi:peptidyl-prolyl cis-trans isomerase B (cyclophilin B)